MSTNNLASKFSFTEIYTEAVVPKGREDEFAMRHGGGEMLDVLVSMDRQMRDLDRRIGVAVEDAMTLSRRRR